MFVRDIANHQSHVQCSEPFYKAAVHDAIAQDSEADREEKRKMMEMLQRFEEGADISLDEDDGGLAEALDGVDLGMYPPLSSATSRAKLTSRGHRHERPIPPPPPSTPGRLPRRSPESRLKRSKGTPRRRDGRGSGRRGCRRRTAIAVSVAMVGRRLGHVGRRRAVCCRTGACGWSETDPAAGRGSETEVQRGRIMVS